MGLYLIGRFCRVLLLQRCDELSNLCLHLLISQGPSVYAKEAVQQLVLQDSASLVTSLSRVHPFRGHDCMQAHALNARVLAAHSSDLWHDVSCMYPFKVQVCVYCENA